MMGTPAGSASQPSHDDWEKAKTTRDMYARLAALAALDDRTADAKDYARSMLASENTMNGVAAALDQYPVQGPGH